MKKVVLMMACDGFCLNEEEHEILMKKRAKSSAKQHYKEFICNHRI
jgi:hypothetical protein